MESVAAAVVVIVWGVCVLPPVGRVREILGAVHVAI